ncbi:helix-turn-helix domain-containing protein [Salinarchaeum laminariae]|uniref:helix-turn-helix domain-containing protein n=1 Tax=Salinarchaeum laminariae TaxID=869888 RepID=UPI0020BFA409|nr:helix-turn-helix domain-containing protein [Salinarchaeum laminariae]
MIDLTMDMEQYDCPFIATTDDHEVSFAAVHWEFDETARELETRLVVEGSSRSTLETGLDALQNHDGMTQCDLFRKRDDTAFIRTVIEETDAMGVIRANDGYITGPFRIADGSETWEVGFDDERIASDALSELERNNEFTVESRDVLALDDCFDLLDNANAAAELLEGCRDLSETERATLSVAADAGYFEQPRDATLQTLADEFEVSDTAVSKNLRRGERKVLRRVVNALESLDTGPSGRAR